MPRVSHHFHLSKSQAELDFADVQVNGDTLLFLDPFAISQRPDRLSQTCNDTIITYFQHLVTEIKNGRIDQAFELLRHLREPNETRLGFSRKKPQGAGIGNMQAHELLGALQKSTAVKTGSINTLEECELMVEGIGRDKISDLTTNVIRGHLAEYAKEQCALHNIPTQSVALPPYYSLATILGSLATTTCLSCQGVRFCSSRRLSRGTILATTRPGTISTSS